MALNPQNQNYEQIKKLIAEAEFKIEEAKKLFSFTDFKKNKNITQDFDTEYLAEPTIKIIEGIFDGEFMIDKNGKKYPVPANYASKSKLVEGDILKLNITENGSFLFKQIKPIERKYVIGEIIKEGDRYFAKYKNQKYKILPAAVSYFEAKHGDESTIILPESRNAGFAALENVIPKTKKT